MEEDKKQGMISVKKKIRENEIKVVDTDKTNKMSAMKP